VAAVLLLAALASWLIVWLPFDPAVDRLAAPPRPATMDRVRASQPPRAALPPPETETAVPPIESPWSRELRRLRDIASGTPDEAIRRVADMADKHERSAAAIAVCREIAVNDPARAMAAAWALELGRLAHETAESTALEELAGRWADRDPLNALLWESSLPPDEEGRCDRVTRGIASAISRSDPEDAARLVVERMNPDSPLHADAVAGIVHEWGRLDAPAASRWVSLFPLGALRDRAMAELAEP
jgi:hypothetical protein